MQSTDNPRTEVQQQYRGRLMFGAARGPSNWLPENDGSTWSPGYWVEINGGPEDGRSIVVSLDDVAGLREGDLCSVELQGHSHRTGDVVLAILACP